MKVTLSGSSGLIGSALASHLSGLGHEVLRLVRRAPADSNEIEWRPRNGSVDATALAGSDALVHLAGENISQGRWTQAKKERIRKSRVEGTRALAEALASDELARLGGPPRVVVSASAIGYYGDRGAEVLREQSPPGKGFLSDVCVEWEAAMDPARAKGIRVVHPRISMVLAKEGGALARMLPPFRMGLGGRIGPGTQYVSWIAIDDLVRALAAMIEKESLSGPVNVAAPNPVTNAELTSTLGKVLGRPTIFPLPAFVARLVFGEMADELLLASTRVDASRLGSSGFEHRHPELEGALRHLLGK